MSIVTKTGDRGKTSLYCGKRVDKDNIRVEICGALDVARAVTRRAERRSVTLLKKGMMKNPNIVIYLNRLSDLLYLLARSSENKK